MPVLYADKDGKDYEECLKLAKDFIADGTSHDKIEDLLKSQNYTSKAIELTLEKLEISSKKEIEEMKDSHYKVSRLVINVVISFILIGVIVFSYDYYKDIYSIGKLMLLGFIFLIEFVVQYFVITFIVDSNPKKHVEVNTLSKILFIALFVIMPMFFLGGMNPGKIFVRFIIITIAAFAYFGIDAPQGFMMGIFIEGLNSGILYLDSNLL